MNSNDLYHLIGTLGVIGGWASIIVGIVKLIRARKNGKGGFYNVKVIAGSLVLALFCFSLPKALNKEVGTSGSYIEQNHPASIASITYGQAIRNVCSNIEWTRTTSESSTTGHAFVQMDADCVFRGNERKLVMQFDYGISDYALINKDTPFSISFVGFDDEQNASISEMQDIVYSMFEFYASENGIQLDESMKSGILYTDGATPAGALSDDAFTGDDIAADSEVGYADDVNYDADAISDAGQAPQEGAQSKDDYEYPYMFYAGGYIISEGNGYCNLMLYAPKEDSEIGTIEVDCESAKFTGTVYDYGLQNEYVVDAGTGYYYLVFHDDGLDPYFDLNTEAPKAAIDAEWMTWGTFYMVSHYQYN